MPSLFGNLLEIAGCILALILAPLVFSAATEKPRLGSAAIHFFFESSTDDEFIEVLRGPCDESVLMKLMCQEKDCAFTQLLSRLQIAGEFKTSGDALSEFAGDYRLEINRGMISISKIEHPAATAIEEFRAATIRTLERYIHNWEHVCMFKYLPTMLRLYHSSFLSPVSEPIIVSSDFSAIDAQPGVDLTAHLTFPFNPSITDFQVSADVPIITALRVDRRVEKVHDQPP
jgi:hypothetical protein